MQSPLVCPTCNKNDQIQKVTSVVATGTISGYHGSAQTGLAESMRKPLPHMDHGPEVGTAFGGGCLLLVPIAIGLIFLGSWLDDSGNLGIAYVLLFGYIAIWLSYVGYAMARSSAVKGPFAERMKAIDDVWMRLYYCFRDDLIFDSGNPKLHGPTVEDVVWKALR
jgi:hypothetical protein